MESVRWPWKMRRSMGCDFSTLTPSTVCIEYELQERTIALNWVSRVGQFESQPGTEPWHNFPSNARLLFSITDEAFRVHQYRNYERITTLEWWLSKDTFTPATSGRVRFTDMTRYEELTVPRDRHKQVHSTLRGTNWLLLALSPMSQLDLRKLSNQTCTQHDRFLRVYRECALQSVIREGWVYMGTYNTVNSVSIITAPTSICASMQFHEDHHAWYLVLALFYVGQPDLRWPGAETILKSPG